MGKQKNAENTYGGATTALPIPPLLRTLISSLFNTSDKNSFLSFSLNYKLFQTLRFIILSSYLFLLRFIPSFFFSEKYEESVKFNLKTHNKFTHDTRNDTAIGRALSQLLSALNDIPVSSRKYEVVRSLTEKIIDDNHLDGVHSLREVNRVALSSAFGRALKLLEGKVAEREGEVEGEGDGGGEYYRMMRRRIWKVVRAVGWRVRGGEGGLGGIPAEKLAAELVWMVKKMVECGCADEAIRRWAAASNLGFLALSADPRLQSSLVKLAAFLFKEAKDLGIDEIEESKIKQCMQVKLKMLQTWLPLLCRASNGTDAPSLSINERAGLERVLEDIIEELEQEKQEQVLSLWLHHFTHCSSSDWPNLHSCYARWCCKSRKQLLLLNEN
ncbi:uncharacterized protein LOC123908175 [Trifolium pratense]|uniref:uncharacterized protein LOC123908175 n=1 Tax=Trifolium pratense TaxID=57577 RepID=UPI001E69250E|nr:uncharacterized protein LOC123908175 [Trifolium pratense]